jgi:hypothetical protein
MTATANADDKRLAELRARFPAWDIWYTLAAVSPTAWSARPAGSRDGAHKTTNDPAGLAEWLAGQKQP